MPQLKLKKFDISSIPSDKVIVLLGKRDTGKSFLLRDILYYQRDIPIGTVISPTEMANKFYSHMVPEVFIHDEYTPNILSNVVKRQKMIKEKIVKEKRAYGSCNIDPRSFLILDDCMYDNIWARDTNIKLLFMNGRHFNMLFAITMQYPLGIPPILRTNIDYTFILRENITSNRKRIYEQYAGMFPSFDMFCQVMDQCTENYECLVIHNNAKSNRLEDQVFWYKAETHDDFHMCAKEFWTLDKGADGPPMDEMEEEDEMWDVRNRPKNSRNPQISVKKTWA